MDILSKAQRHRNMSAIRSKNTKPELLVRKFLFSKGYRYRVNKAGLPGKPDIVLRKYRTCIFIHGCFWHGHEGCKYFRVPKTNTEFWQKKIEHNHERDLRDREKLKEIGWHTIVIWECQLKSKVREQTLFDLDYTLNQIYLQDRTKYKSTRFSR